MAVSCEAKCGKSILISFTLFHWLAGGAILVLGVCIFLEPAKLFLFNFVTSDKLGKEYGYYLAYGLIVLSAAIFVVGIFGCCGAIEENRGLLVVYAVLLLILLLTNLGIAAFTIIYREFWLVELEDRLSSQLLTNYGPRSGNQTYLSFTNAMDFTQYKFGCCGVKSHEDYILSRWWNESMSSTERRIRVPATCCAHLDGDEEATTSSGSPISVVSRVFRGTVEEPWQNPTLKDDIACQDIDPEKHTKFRFTEGCFKAIEEWFRRESTILATVGISSAVLQMIGMVLTTFLLRNLTADM